MTRLSAIEFDDCVLDALRDNRLVVFAGAGVSMGAPSNLDDFGKLSRGIAEGTGLAPAEREPLDHFLGRLEHRKVAVHERAVQRLSPEGSVPNALHHNLLRLFQTVEQVRLVTTNFDLHFETAAEAVFGDVPNVYRAPALPLGHNFSGIVHVHGALPNAQELVLTDADFGRAYLTEGWARRFLVDVFRHYTVLFVGYRHSDVVMNYLARALPADSASKRFALTDEVGNWELLGIKPISFQKGSGDAAYDELYDGIKRLAERMARGALDWQSRLAELADRAPPTDEEAISEVEQALREVHTTRFLLDVARDPEWLCWLNRRGHLTALFGTADLDERKSLLIDWLAKHHTLEHPEGLFEIISEHGLRLHPALWYSIGRVFGSANEKLIEDSVLKRWVTILLASAPVNPDSHAFMWLAERCAKQGCIELALTVFMAMSKHRLSIKPGFTWPAEDEGKDRKLTADCQLQADHWTLNEVWTKLLEGHLPQIAPSLLSGITLRFEEMYSDLSAWDKASRDWDPISFGRSAIEPHEQDDLRDAMDVLIDAARDALESLARQSLPLLDAWIEKLVVSDVPLLRRLAIHAMTARPELSPEQRLMWLLERVGLHGISEHHEVYRAAALSYPHAAKAIQEYFVLAILAHEEPASEHRDSEERTARLHFDWLSWLTLAKPDCTIATKALAPIKARYPNWQQSDHPDLTHWSGSAEWVRHESPWSIEQLVHQKPHQQLDDLLNFKGDHFDEPSREGLLANVQEATKQKVKWAFALAQALEEREEWSSDLWPALFRGLRVSELSIEDWSRLLTLLSNTALQSAHAYDISNLLYALVKDGGKPFALDLLEQANAIALPFWKSLQPEDPTEEIGDWLSRAINRPAGVVVEFWVNSLSLLMRDKTGSERTLPDDYRCWLTLVMNEETDKGGMGRSVLASQTAFLFGLDEAWTQQHLIPLFSSPDPHRFEQAWDGFLVWGRLYPAIVDALLPAFLTALPRIDDKRNDHRRRFMEYFASLALFHISDPSERLLPALFQEGLLDDRLAFASHLGYYMRKMQQPAKQQLWDRWLRRYWQDRQQGVYAPLDGREVKEMIEWLPLLGDAFPEAVELATRSPKTRIQHSHALYDLRKSELVTRFPSETAELLIYLAHPEVGAYNGDLAVVAGRLTELPEQVQQRLNEALARAGVF